MERKFVFGVSGEIQMLVELGKRGLLGKGPSQIIPIQTHRESQPIFTNRDLSYAKVGITRNIKLANGSNHQDVHELDCSILSCAIIDLENSIPQSVETMDEGPARERAFFGHNGRVFNLVYIFIPFAGLSLKMIKFQHTQNNP